MLFDLHFDNPLGVALAAIPALLNAILLIIAVRGLPRDRTTQAFTLFVASLIAWQCFDVAVRLAATQETAALWRALLRMGQFLALPASVHLALRLSERDQLANNGVVAVLLYTPSIIFQGCYEAGLIQEKLTNRGTWGWIADPDPSWLWTVMSGWFSILAIAAPIVLATHMHAVRNQPERFAAMRLVTLGISFPVLLGVVAEVGLPTFGIQQIPITSTTLSAFSVACLIALFRYDLFRVNTLGIAQAAISTVTDPVIIASPQGRIVFANKAAQAMQELRADMRIEDLLDPADRDAFLTGPWRACIGGRGVPGLELLMMRDSAASIHMMASLAPLPIRPGVRGAVLVAHDVSPLHKAMAAVQNASRAKSHFLANMSHELRTPLNAIIGYAELLGEDADYETTRDLERIESSGRYLLGLINDVLDISKVESGKLDVRYERVDVAAMIAALNLDATKMCTAKGNTFAVQEGPPCEVWVDRMRLRQVLLNLLSNAAKFTHSGEVILHWRTEEEQVRIDVVDSGIGMNDEQVGRLFEPFSQVHQTDHATYRGTGLGLAISQRLCRAMGGDLTVSSEPGSGSTFVVWLPQYRAELHGDDPSRGSQPVLAMACSTQEPNTRS